jgi:hypothetical protein
MRCMLFILLVACCAGCNHPSPPSDEREGLGGKSGSGDPWRPTPAERTGSAGETSPMAALTADEQRALDSLRTTTSMVSWAAGSGATSSREVNALLQDLDTRRRTLMRRVRDVTGVQDVEYEGRARREFSQFVGAAGAGDQARRAMLAELAGAYERDVAALEVLGRSSDEHVRAVAAEAMRELSADRDRLRGAAELATSRR